MANIDVPIEKGMSLSSSSASVANIDVPIETGLSYSFDLQISMHAQSYFRRIALVERVAFTGEGICRMRGSAQLPRRSVRTGTRSALTDAKAVGRSSATAW